MRKHAIEFGMVFGLLILVKDYSFVINILAAALFIIGLDIKLGLYNDDDE